MKKKSTPTRHGASKPAALDGALQLAMTDHQAGRLADAERRYRALLAGAPRHPDALHYLGVLLHQQGRSDAALPLIARALACAPGYVDARNNLGNVQKELGQMADAEQSYRTVIAVRPAFAPAWNNLGVVLKAQGRYADAAQAYRQCLTLAPESADCWLNLGSALKAHGDLQGAMTAYHQAILLAPQIADAYRNLGQALLTSGRHAEALDVYRQWQEQEPDNDAISHMIAAVAGGAVPGRASDSYVQTTFDRFASSFDDVLTGLDYRAPALCAALVESLLGPAAAHLAVLDAGCGTGLCAPSLLPYASTLDGVDLSPNMLEKAALRHSYRHLHEAELTAWLAMHPASYDLIVSADTLCYFGALEEVVIAAATALRPGGHLVFTLELTVDAVASPQFALNPHGRYSHAETYARKVLGEAGLAVLDVQHAVLRTELEMPVQGLVIGARCQKAVFDE